MTTKNGRDSSIATGTVHGRVITLDLPVPELDGRRVRVLLRPAEDVDVHLDPGQQANLWKEWMEGGEQGPIDDEDSFP